MFFWWLQVFFPLEQNQNHRTDHKHAAANCNHGQAIRKTHAFVILSGHTGRSLFTAAEIGWIALLSVLLSTLLSTPLIFVHLSTLLSTVLVRGCRAVILLCIRCLLRPVCFRSQIHCLCLCRFARLGLLRSAWHIGLFSAKIGAAFSAAAHAAALHTACVEGRFAAVQLIFNAFRHIHRIVNQRILVGRVGGAYKS